MKQKRSNASSLPRAAREFATDDYARQRAQFGSGIREGETCFARTREPASTVTIHTGFAAK
jgi:hypothetical protein